MTTPTFSAISDLHSVTQLQRALFEAEQIAHGFLACYIEQKRPTPELLAAHGRLVEASGQVSVQYATNMQRSAPKVSNG